MAFRPDGDVVVYGRGGSLWSWDLGSSTGQRVMLDGFPGHSGSGRLSPDGRLLIVQDWDLGIVEMWDTSTGTQVDDSIRGDSDFGAWSFSPNSSFLAIADSNGTVIVKDTRAGGTVGRVSTEADLRGPCGQQ